MKKITILLLLTYSLFAKELTFTIPVALQLKLCQQLAQNTNRCENGSTIDYYRHLILSNDELLIYVYLNEHARSYGQTHSAIPIVVNSIGEWKATAGANIISEDIESLHQDPHDNIWVRAIWHVEGVYPALYHSSDALHWKRTRLPENREVDCCFETLDEPSFQWDTMKLTFRDLDNKRVKSWETSYASAMSNTPNWHSVSNIPVKGIQNSHKTNWKVEKSKSAIYFTNTRSQYTMKLPIGKDTQKNLYHVQIGAFSKMSSAKIVMNSLKKMPYQPYTMTTLVKGTKYIKLLIGDFTSKRKARFILSKIKKEHQNNPTLQKAFILSSKP